MRTKVNTREIITSATLTNANHAYSIRTHMVTINVYLFDFPHLNAFFIAFLQWKWSEQNKIPF